MKLFVISHVTKALCSWFNWLSIAALVNACFRSWTTYRINTMKLVVKNCLRTKHRFVSDCRCCIHCCCCCFFNTPGSKETPG